ncbi:MAG: helix-turn-helix transcriptional regulator [Bacteroidetes bacterium]|nr:helix-turn-helix transcriptional regulator [Bacteroidota bacterium]
MNKSQFNKTLGAFIKNKRQELNMSQSNLAAKLENNFQNISRLERGEVSPTLYWFFKLAEAFEQEPNALITEFEKYSIKKK